MRTGPTQLLERPVPPLATADHASGALLPGVLTAGQEGVGRAIHGTCPKVFQLPGKCFPATLVQLF